MLLYLMLLLAADPSLPKMDAFLAALERGRTQEMNRLQREFYKLEDDLKKGRGKDKNARTIRKQMMTLNKRHKVLNTGSISARKLPNLESKKFEEGQIGLMPGTYEILQIIDDQSLIAIPEEKKGKVDRFKVKGIATNDFAEGDKVPLPKTFIVTGIDSYTTEAGSKATVFAIQTFDTKPYRAALNKKYGTKSQPPSLPTSNARTPQKSKKGSSRAASKLRLAKQLFVKRPEAARKRLKEIIEKYPDSKEAKEAAKMLKSGDRD